MYSVHVHIAIIICTVFITAAAVKFSLARVRLIEGGFRAITCFSNSQKNKQQNQAKNDIYHAFASDCNFGHTHLIVFVHACGLYSRVVTISFTELHVRQL